MFKLALVCAVLVTAAAEKCNTECMLFTKYEEVVDGKTEDFLAAMPENLKKCDETKAIACTDNTVCFTFSPTIKADTTVDDVKSGKLTIETTSEMCLASGTEMTSELCDAFSTSFTGGIEGVINGKKIANLNTDCGNFSAASGFGFSAILVTIMYILY